MKGVRKMVPLLVLGFLAVGFYVVTSGTRNVRFENNSHQPDQSLGEVENATGETQALSDEHSSAEAGTEVISEKWKVVPPTPQPPSFRELYDPKLPLTREIVFVEAAAAKVSQGWLRVPVGARARLVQDHGATADVRLGDTTINVPRWAVASNSSARNVETRPAAPPSGITGFFTNLFQPLPNSLGIDVKEIGTGKGIDRKWETDWGSYQRDFYRTKGLQVDVNNVSRRGSGNCQAEVYWFARQLKDRKLVIHHREVIPLEVGPITSVSRRFWSPLAASGVDKYVYLNRTDVAGVKLDGWAVAITRDGKILAGRGSGPEQDGLAKSESRLGTLVADYRPTGRSATAGMPQWRKDPIRTEWGNRRGGYQEAANPEPDDRIRR